MARVYIRMRYTSVTEVMLILEYLLIFWSIKNNSMECHLKKDIKI